MKVRTAVVTMVSLALIAVAGAQAKTGGNAASCALPQGREHAKIDPAGFTTKIDNPWWPMAQGSRWIYRETAPDGSKVKDVVTVSTKTKRVADGVTTRIVHDVATEDGKPVEVTDDYYAQDRCGNVWYFGEATAEYENGKVSSRHGSFEAGVGGAEPGVILPAKPRPGLGYRQEFAAGQAEDRGEIVSVSDQAETPYGHFARGRVLMTRDLNPLEPKNLEFKFYARGVGPVLAIAVSGGSDREELVSYTRGR